MADEKFNFMLMGKTGQGKSATGNMLLNRRVFKASPTLTSQTKEVDFNFAQFKNNIFLVVDGPGLQDTAMDKVRDKELAVKNMDQALAMCYGGVNAFLFTIKFGTRFTPEEQATLESLKKIFGDDYMKFLIVIVTCGDLFQIAMEDELMDISFEDWCKEQKGEFRQLYEECNGRFVLFNNITKVQQERDSQIQQVISLTRDLKNKYGTYTAQCFKNAEYEREKLIVELKAPELTRAIQERLSLLTADIEVYSKQPSDNLKEQLIRRVQNLKAEIKIQDKGYNVLTNLMKTVEKVEEILRDVELQRLAVELEEKLRDVVELQRLAVEQEEKFRDVVELQRLAVELENTRNAKKSWGVLGSICTFAGSALALVAPPVGVAVAAGARIATGIGQLKLDSDIRNNEAKQSQIRQKHTE